MDRRAFILQAAAVVCVGCGRDDDARVLDQGRERDIEITGHFGGTIGVGSLDDVLAAVDDADGFLHIAAARSWIVRYPAHGLASAERAYDAVTFAGMQRGLLALHQKCTHLGCRVPECTSSNRFECPCHGSIFNAVGEWVAGPAPRGMDRFALSLNGDEVQLDTSAPLEGLGRGVLTVDVEPDGPACIRTDER